MLRFQAIWLDNELYIIKYHKNKLKLKCNWNNLTFPAKYLKVKLSKGQTLRKSRCIE